MKKLFYHNYVKNEYERGCTNCLFFDLCDTSDLSGRGCSSFWNNDTYIDDYIYRKRMGEEELHWGEMSYHKYQEGLLDFNFDEYADGDWCED